MSVCSVGKGIFLWSIKGFPLLSKGRVFCSCSWALCTIWILCRTQSFLHLYDTCSRSSKEAACLFFFLWTKMKSNYFLWALSSGIALSCSDKHSCCSFPLQYVFLIFCLPPSLTHNAHTHNTHLQTLGMCPTGLTDQITAHQRTMWSVSVERERKFWKG